MTGTGSKLEVSSAPPNGVVLPRPLKWHQRFAASFVYALIRVIAFTLRFEWQYHPAVLSAGPRSFIFAIWHNRLAIAMLMYGDYARRRRQAYQLAALVSASKDGGVVARVLEHFGAEPVRGSSSRRGPQALLELTTWAERGYDLAITPDGPRGPRYVVQDGAVALAQLTGQPVVPCSMHIGWKISMRSWDRFQIPLPFARVVLKFGEPVLVPRDISESSRETLRSELEKRLKALTVD